MLECKLNTTPTLGVIIPENYNSPKAYMAKVYMCKLCGKVDIYADIEKEKT